MPQNALVGWKFAWPKWSNPFSAVNKKYVDDAVAGLGVTTPKTKERLDTLEAKVEELERDLKRLRHEAGYA